MSSPTQKANTPSELPCPTWVFSERADTHIATDKVWFSDDFTPFESFVLYKDSPSNPPKRIPVKGFGTVKLPIKSIRPVQACDIYGTIVLRKTLFCPTFEENLIGNPIWEKQSRPRESMDIAHIRSASESIVFEDHRQPVEITISEPPLGPATGPSSYSRYVSYWHYQYHVRFPDAEMERLDVAFDLLHRPSNLEPYLDATTRAFMERESFKRYHLSNHEEEDREEVHLPQRGMMNRKSRKRSFFSMKADERN